MSLKVLISMHRETQRKLQNRQHTNVHVHTKSRNCTLSFRPKRSGEEFMNQQDIPWGTDFDLWQNQIGMLVFGAFFFILTYINLVRADKYK